MDLHCGKDSGSWLSQLSSLLIIMTQKYDVIASILTKQGKGDCYGLKNLLARFFLYVKVCFVYTPCTVPFRARQNCLRARCRQSVYLRYSSAYECTQFILHILEVKYLISSVFSH